MVQPDAVTTDLREHFVQVPNVACSSRAVTIPPRLSRSLSKDSCLDARTFPREPIELAEALVGLFRSEQPRLEVWHDDPDDIHYVE